MASVKTSSKLHVLKSIIRELRHCSGHKTRNPYGYNYLLEQYRFNQTADDKVAREKSTNANNYLCLLQSVRVKQYLHKMYKGEGERPVEEVARMVGFNMPELYQDPDGPVKKKT